MEHNLRGFVLHTDRIRIAIRSDGIIYRGEADWEGETFSIVCADPVYDEIGALEIDQKEDVLGFYRDVPIYLELNSDAETEIQFTCDNDVRWDTLFCQSGRLVVCVRAQSLGECRFHVVLDGEDYLELTGDIFPKRLGYRKDFRLMREDVCRIFVGEAFGVYLAYLDDTLARLQPGWSSGGRVRPMRLFEGKERFRLRVGCEIPTGLGQHWNGRLSWDTAQARWINRIHSTVEGQIADMRQLDPDAVSVQLLELKRRRAHPALRDELGADAPMEPCGDEFVSSIAALFHAVEFGKILEKYDENQIAELYRDWCYTAIYRSLCRAMHGAVVQMDDSQRLCTVFERGACRVVLERMGAAIVLSCYFSCESGRRYLFYPDYYGDAASAFCDAENGYGALESVCGRWILYPGDQDGVEMIPLLPQVLDPLDRLVGRIARDPAVLGRCLDGFDERNVLLGVLRNRKQIEDNVRFHFYHIPAQNIPPECLGTRYIALFQSPVFFEEGKSGVRIFGEVESCRLMRRRDIREIPPTRDPEQLYYRFDIKKWHRLDWPVLPGEFGPKVCMSTNYFLLHNAKCVDELYIQNVEQWRLYCMLKRYFSRPKIVLEGERAVGFDVEGNRVEIERGLIRCCDGGGERRIWRYDQVMADPAGFAAQFQGRVGSVHGKDV